MTEKSRPAATGPDQRVAFLQLLTLLAGTPTAVRRLGLLSDRSDDAGLFGRESTTWRVAREPLLLASGSRALLMQLAHPLVAQGVGDHSRFQDDAFGRLLATVRWALVVVFGTTAEARSAINQLRHVHQPVRGALAASNATPRFRPSATYDALDPVLGLWVHATLVDSMLSGYELLIARLGREQANGFVREWNVVAELLGVLPEHPWRGRDDLRAYVESQIAGGIVRPVPASLSAARFVLRPRLPWPSLAPLARTIALISAGSLDPRLRTGYGLRWNGARQIAFEGVCTASRLAAPLLPRRLRVSPLYDLARARLGFDGNLIRSVGIPKFRT